MPELNRLVVGWKAFWQLGPTQVSLNAFYRLGLRTGLWKRLTPPGAASRTWQGPVPPAGFQRLPALAQLRAAYRQFMEIYPQAVEALVQEADEICAGQVRLFGAEPVPLELDPGLPLEHWTEYERGKIKAGPEGDVKFVWEPARFGWAFTLARASLLTGKDDYAQCFWECFEQFNRANPANLGANWMSGQEAALRLTALLFCLHLFADAPASTPERQQQLLDSAVQHARRIPPTLLYARSQHNNHLITEALGLYTAGVLLDGHPEANNWQKTGWHWLERALVSQIATDGSYAQHSSNYHRLMLQAALWGNWLAHQTGQEYAPAVLGKLSAATEWLLGHMDSTTGQAANLGSNDGANIFPLSTAAFGDYRPTAQAASRAFRGQPAFVNGDWDELSFWMGLLELSARPPEAARQEAKKPPRPNDRRLESVSSWASMRAAEFTSRPAHADQLHVELWMRGYNIALDAGTYRYTARPPWDNALAATCVHNTLTMDGSDQMLRAGRFLWLDWAQTRWTEVTGSSVKAAYDGISQQAIVHARKLSVTASDTWLVEDEVQPAFRKLPAHTITLNWLLPDWQWYLEGTRLLLTAPFGTLAVDCQLVSPADAHPHVRLIREGKSLLDAQPADPILGWYSPTYSVKATALSFQLVYTGKLPVSFSSQFSIVG